jgi:hypothetical protein
MYYNPARAKFLATRATSLMLTVPSPLMSALGFQLLQLGVEPKEEHCNNVMSRMYYFEVAVDIFHESDCYFQEIAGQTFNFRRGP